MARNQSDTAKHVIRILQQGGVAADNLTTTLFNGNEALADKVTRLVRRGESQASINREIRSHITALSAEAKEQLVSDSMRSGAYQAASTTSYIGSLSRSPTTAYKITKTAVMQIFKLPLPGQNVTVNDLFTGVMTGMSKSTVNITQTAFQSGGTVRQMASQIREAMEDPMVTSSIRRKSEALARTTIAKVANETRTATYLANDDIVDRVLYSATLDSRTTDICMVNDGLWWYLGDPGLQQPPLHVNCRSTLVPVLEGENMNTVKKDLTRPEVVPKSQEQYEKQGLTTRTGRTRKPSTTDKSPLERLDGKKYKNYEGWLKSQPDYYQKDILGPKAFKEFKSSGSLRKALGKTNISQSTWKPPTTTKMSAVPSASKPMAKVVSPVQIEAKAKAAWEKAIKVDAAKGTETRFVAFEKYLEVKIKTVPKIKAISKPTVIPKPRPTSPKAKPRPTKVSSILKKDALLSSSKEVNVTSKYYFTGTEKTELDRLHRTSLKITAKKKPQEMLSVIDSKTDDVVVSLTGNENSIRIPGNLIDHFENRTMIHNHPAIGTSIDNSLSLDDFTSLYRMKQKKMLAISDGGTIFEVRPIPGVASYDMERAYRASRDVVITKLRTAIAANKFPKKYLNDGYAHLLNVEMRAKGLLKYRVFSPSPRFQSILKALDDAEIY